MREQRGDAGPGRHARPRVALLIRPITNAHFDAETLRFLDAAKEVKVETVRPDGSRRRTVIWIMVDGEDVFVRSWKGDRGFWYQSAAEPHAEVALIINRRRVAVSVHDATDDESVARCSEQLRRKYARSQSLAGMLRPEVLGTTLRLEPIPTRAR